MFKITFIPLINEKSFTVGIEKQKKLRCSFTLYFQSDFHQKYQPKFRIRYSLKNLSYREGLLNIPHFMSDYTLELIKQITHE